MMGFDFDPFASGLDQPARIYTGPPPGQRTDWYVSEQHPVALSPEQRAAARRAPGLDGGHWGPRPAPHRANGRAALAAYWERQRVKLNQHVRAYSSWSRALAPAAVGPAYGGTDVMRGHRTHDGVGYRGVPPREAESNVRRGVA